jgi:hypothetical protein
MRTSLIETRQIEAHLLQLWEPGDALVFEARLLLEPELRGKMQWQKETYNLIRQYGRHQLKQEIEAVHQQLFTEPKHAGFGQKIMRLFSKK